MSGLLVPHFSSILINMSSSIIVKYQNVFWGLPSYTYGHGTDDMILGDSNQYSISGFEVRKEESSHVRIDIFFLIFVISNLTFQNIA